MNKQEVVYISSKTQLGYFVQHKYLKEMDLDNPPLKNEKVKTFYDESVIFLNIADGRGLIVDGKFVELSDEDIKLRTKELAKKFFNLATSSSYEYWDTKRDSSSQSLKEMLKEAIEKRYNIKLEAESVVFSVEKYQEVQNEWIVFSAELDSANSFFTKKLVAGINTILALENIVPYDNETNLFCSNSGDDEEFLSYSEAMSFIRNCVDYLSLAVVKKTRMSF